jgi:hypothetical protein
MDQPHSTWPTKESYTAQRKRKPTTRPLFATLAALASFYHSIRLRGVPTTATTGDVPAARLDTWRTHILHILDEVDARHMTGVCTTLMLSCLPPDHGALPGPPLHHAHHGSHGPLVPPNTQ